MYIHTLQVRKLFMCKTAEEIQTLIKEKVPVDAVRADGRTPLIFHTASDNKEVVQELIKLKADVNLQDNDGLSALMVASQNGYMKIAQCLIFAGAIPDLKSKEVISTMKYKICAAIHSL